MKSVQNTYSTDDCLIGSSGFIGSNLVKQHQFEATFNSKNFDAARGASFNTVVCAAAPGSMFEANRMAERDRQCIDGLIEQLSQISARRMILVSTIAVLKGFAAPDEVNCSFEQTTPYGINRRRLEEFVLERFPDSLVVRLPSLFGDGLKKNFLFDMLNPVPSMLTNDKFEHLKASLPVTTAAQIDDIYDFDANRAVHVINRHRLHATGKRQQIEEELIERGISALQFTNPDSRFQFYDLARLWGDIALGVDAGLRILHLAPPALKAGDVYKTVTGRELGPNDARVHREDMRTAYSDLWEKNGAYIADEDDVLGGLQSYFARVEAE